MHPRILVIHDDLQIQAQLGRILEREHVDAILENDAQRALELLKSDTVDAVFTDLWLKSDLELDILHEIRGIQPSLPVVVVTACSSVEAVVKAFRLGVADYLTMPFEAEQAAAALARVSVQATERPQSKLAPRVNQNGAAASSLPSFVAASPAMKQLVDVCQRVAPSALPILVIGELGVGKERLVRLIHSLSPRRDGPFLKVNCEAIQESQLAEIFFGENLASDSEGGSSRPGLIERAADGTLLLQNVTGLPRWMQEKLLQAVQEGQFFRVAGGEPVPFRARIAASTLSDPAESVKRGVLLDEFYSFLSLTSFEVPPLRKRCEDVRPLVETLASQAAGDPTLSDCRPALRFTPHALKQLEAYDWPGNILELNNFIRRIFVFTNGPDVTAAQVSKLLPTLPTPQAADTITVPFVGNLKRIERAIVAEVINRAHGNKSAAARSLGLHRKTLYRIIENERPEPSRQASG